MIAHIRRAGLMLGAGLLLAASSALAQVPAPAEETPEMFPAGPNRDEAFYACVACHNFKLVAAQGMSRARWDDTIAFMIERHGMPAIGDEDRKLIVDYLAAAFPERAQQRRGWRNPFAE